MVSAREVAELLDERPDLEPAIEAVLAADPPWSFQDVDVDSGRFGELVARGVVVEGDEGYRVADIEAVTRALEGGHTGKAEPSGFSLPRPELDVNRLEIGYLAGAIGLVILFRLLSFPSVYVDGQVVLSGNDPYAYRYIVDQMLLQPAVTPSELPGGMSKGEPLYVTTIWLAALLLGGTPAIGGHVLAWYPVVSAVLTAGFVYVAAVLVTDDRRIGLAAVTMLAVLPAHAFRTSLGFADHHPFDYLWLALSVLGLVLLAWTARRSEGQLHPFTLAGVLVLALGLTGQTLAWDNSPIILAALGPYIALEALRAVYADESPGRTLGPVLIAAGLAAVAVWLVHDQLNWHTTLVAASPTLAFLGGVGVIASAELYRRVDAPVAGLALVEVIVAGVGIAVLRTARPEFWTRLTTSVESRLLAPRPIAEVQSIFSEAGGWLLLFGFILVIALPYLIWASYRAIDDGRWLPVVVYGWYFFVLSAIQARFVGEFAPVISIVAGLAFVHLAERIEVARRPAPFTDQRVPELRVPTARQVGYLLALFLLVASLSLVQVPVKTSQVTTPPQLAETAFYLADDSEARDLAYPENYVFSEWGKNRVYNYFVSGESRSYGYARSNFDEFLTSVDGPGWYDRLSPRSYIVVSSRAGETESPQLGSLLYEHHGSQTGSHPGLGHYRLIYVSETGSYKAFALVDGAVLEGEAAPNATVIASTEVDVPGATVEYSRSTTADASGNYSIRVANPGTYTVADETVTVPESAVSNGSRVTISR